MKTLDAMIGQVASEGSPRQDVGLKVFPWPFSSTSATSYLLCQHHFHKGHFKRWLDLTKCDYEESSICKEARLHV